MTVYPNLNLLDGTKDFSGDWSNGSFWTTDGTYNGLTVKKRINKGAGLSKIFTAPADGTYTFSSDLKTSGNGNIIRWVNTNGKDGAGTTNLTSNDNWFKDTASVPLPYPASPTEDPDHDVRNDHMRRSACRSDDADRAS